VAALQGLAPTAALQYDSDTAKSSFGWRDLTNGLKSTRDKPETNPRTPPTLWCFFHEIKITK
jgi:hypothetical protein